VSVLLPQPGGVLLRPVLDEPNALPLVLETIEAAPAALLALRLRGRECWEIRARTRERDVRFKGNFGATRNENRESKGSVCWPPPKATRPPSSSVVK
jgi:hypothetical protein